MAKIKNSDQTKDVEQLELLLMAVVLLKQFFVYSLVVCIIFQKEPTQTNYTNNRE